MDFIPLHIPDLGGNCLKYAQEVLESGNLSQGRFVERLETETARRLQRRFALATSSGTAALHLGLLCLEVGGGEVLVSDLTFVAPANAVRYCGAVPVFVDAEASWQMNARLLRRWLARWERDSVNAATGRPLSAILPVHILGGGCDMPAIMACARNHGLRVLEDASQALGTEIAGRPAGSYGDVAVLSFNANKTVAGGGGGMLLTDDPAVVRRAKYLAWQARDGPGYVHQEIGYNYRMSELQAAVILAQMERLEEILAAKRDVAAAYQEVLGDIPGLSPMPVPGWIRPSWWLWSAIVPNGRGLRAALTRVGIDSRSLWQPMHESPAHGGYVVGEGAVASWLYPRVLSLPSSPGLGREGALQVARVARGFLLNKQ